LTDHQVHEVLSSEVTMVGEEVDGIDPLYNKKFIINAIVEPRISNHSFTNQVQYKLCQGAWFC